MGDDDAPAQGEMKPGRSLRWTIIAALIAIGAVFAAGAAIEGGRRDRETIAAIVALQSEMAKSAASEVRQFIADIETAMRSSAQSAVAAAQGLAWSFRLELLDLLRAAPAIASASALGLDGMEVARAARDELIDPTDLRDQSTSIAFQRARQGEVYFGRPTLVRGSEPFMTIALPIVWFEGQLSGVLVAEIGLRDLSAVLADFWESRGARAYVVTDEGAVIAHPQSSLMLQALNLSQLDHVRNALAGEPIAFEPVAGVEGQPVIAAFAPIDDLQWIVLIERPAAAVLTPISASHVRIVLLLALGLGLLGALGLLLGIRVLRPVAALRAGAARIRLSVFDRPVAIAADDEFREIAAALNDMAARWHRLDATLATQVDFRRKELGAALLRAASFGEGSAALRLEAEAVLGQSPNTPGGPATIGETIGLLEKARIETPGHETRLLVAIETALCRAYALAGRPQDALRAYEHAVAGAEKLGDDEVLFHPLHAIASARSWPDLLSVRLDAGRRGLNISVGRQFDAAIGDLVAWHFTDLLEAGRAAEAKAVVSTASRLAVEHGDEVMRIRVRHTELLFALQAGIEPALEQEIEAVREQGVRSGFAAAASLHRRQMFTIRREQAQPDEARQYLKGAHADEDRPPHLPAMFALLNCDGGSPSQARAIFEELASAGFAAIPRDERWTIAMAYLAELCAQLGDSSRAVALQQLLDPYAGRNVVSEGICLGAADRYLGMLAATRGDWATAESRYQSAVALSELSEAPVWRAHTLLDLAKVLIARHGPGDQARAADLMDEALAAAAALGLARLRDGCLAVLSVRPGEGPVADGLSTAELRVLRLLASGATNRAIGAQLFLSQHTVANHVRNILAKTNTANRTEAANYARRHNLAADE